MIRATLHTAAGNAEITSDTWLNDVLKKGYQAFIFDCDGTLVESANVHFTSFAKAAEDQGYQLDRDWYFARTGLDRRSLFQEFAGECARGFDIEAAAENSISRFVEISDRVMAIPETETLVRQLGLTFPLAVGTNAERQVAEASLRATGLIDCFDHIVAITDNLKPKPSPEIFAKAAEMLGVPRMQNLVIEDSIQGVTAAKAAGLDVIEIKSHT